MGTKCYTLAELQSVRFYELPNVIYNAILNELDRVICGSRGLTPGLLRIFNNALIFELDQYVDIYKYITVI